MVDGYEGTRRWTQFASFRYLRQEAVASASISLRASFSPRAFWRPAATNIPFALARDDQDAIEIGEDKGLLTGARNRPQLRRTIHRSLPTLEL